MVCQAEKEDCKVQSQLVPGPAPRSPCTLEPQEVIWTDVPNVIKLEPVEETDGEDPLLLEGLDSATLIKGERICKEDQESCHDQKLFVPNPVAGSSCKSDQQEMTRTDYINVRAAIKQEPMACASIYDNDELISDRTFEAFDEDTYFGDPNSSKPRHGHIDSEILQGIDCKVTTPVKDVADQGEEAFGEDAQHNHASSLGAWKSFQCDLCKRWFRLKATLRMHISAHSRNKLYQCQVCNNRFKWPSSLARHSTVHSGLKPYQCHVCDKGFLSSSNLTTHSRTHSVLTPYRCQDCGKQFSDRSNLITHSIIHLEMHTV